MTPTRWILPAVAAVAVLVAPSGALLCARAPAGPAAAGLAVTVARVAVGEIVQSILVSGTMVARDEVLVVPEVDGLAITEILAEEGDEVAAGQVLARLNRASLETQQAQNEAQIAHAEAGIAQSSAQIEEAEANLAQATTNLDRSKALRAKGNVSQETFDQREAAARSAEARLTSARQALAMAKADLVLARAQGREIDVKLARTEIRAPAAGIISSRNARLGAMAAMAATEPLFRIIAKGAVELEVDVAEVELPQVRLGQPVAVTPAGGASPLAGSVRLISPEVDRRSRLGRVRVALAGNPPIAIGSFARGVIETGRRNGVLLPLSAVAYGRDGATVQSVAAGRVATRKVELGLADGARVEILSGVAEGETVVARAGTFLRDGDLVTPIATPDGVPSP